MISKMHRLNSWMLGVLLAILFLFTFLTIGFHYETNDDVLITFMLRGISINPPITDLSLYFHGYSGIIARLYSYVPTAPWYGIILYSLLLLASILAFRLLVNAVNSKQLSPGSIFLLLLFYLSSWYEHVFWFNYGRVPLLLAAVATLSIWFDGQRLNQVSISRKFIYGSMFLLALGIRPSMALFGFGLALPVIFFNLHGARRGLGQLKSISAMLIPFLSAGLLFGLFLQVKSTPATAEYTELDILKSQILDYNWCCPPDTNNQQNTIIQTGIQHWFLADPYVKSFLRQNSYLNGRYFWYEVFPAKIGQLGKYLLLDQFLALTLVLGHLVWLYQVKEKQVFKFLIGYQVYFWGIILLVGIFLKMPPRLLSPAVSVLLLIHVLVARPKISWRGLPVWIKGLGLLLVALQLFKIGHRAEWQNQRQEQSEQVLTQIKNQYPDYLLVTAGLANELRALSPFRNDDLGNRPVLFLTGWQTLDPHFPAYWQQLSGSPDLAETIWRLSRQEKVIWVWSPAFNDFLEKYLQTFYRKPLRFKVLGSVGHSSPSENLHYYRVMQ